MGLPSQDITGLLEAWTSGQAGALNRLVEITYPELRHIALRYFSRERADHTLECTALIHEAYLRLVRTSDKQWVNRAHFFGFASRLMRTILVDHARKRRAAKRQPGGLSVTTASRAAGEPALDVLDLNRALDELERMDTLQSRIVELRYFGGLSIEETAEVTGVSPTSVKREWVLAKTWLRRRLLEAGSEN